MASRRMKTQQPGLSCQDVEEMIRPYLEEQLTAAETRTFETHMDGCAACELKMEKRNEMIGFLGQAMASRNLSEGFTDEATMKLARSKDNPPSLSPSRRAAPHEETGHVEEFDDYDEDEENQVAAPAVGFFDSLSQQFGAAPWWMISGAFHALLLLLVTLIFHAIMQNTEPDQVIVTNLEKIEEPEEEEEKPERTIIPQTQITESEVESEQPEIVTHEEVEIAEHVETPDDSDAEDSNGEDGMSDAFLGGNGSVAALGVGGGGRAGAFGRPGGAGGRLRRATRGGGGKKTESAVDKALEWLARHQEANGSWSCKNTEGSEDWDIGISGLATLAFLGAGHTEKIGKYKKNVQLAVAYIISQQDAQGAIGASKKQFGYHHSIAGMAIAEAFAMARVKATGVAAQKAIDWSTNQHQFGGQSDKFGWRYKPKDRKGDLSNSGWFIMQLKSAKVAGLGVDPASFEGAIKYMDARQAAPVAQNQRGDSSFDNGGHRYGYDSKKPWNNTTAIGCLGRLFTGTPANEVAGAVNWLVQVEPPRWDAKMGKGVHNLSFPMYYMYYMTLTTFQVGNDTWKNWNVGMKNTLLPNQRRDGDADGSWDPLGNAHEKKAGRAYTTAMGALCLEVYYRYLPMYR